MGQVGRDLTGDGLRETSLSLSLVLFFFFLILKLSEVYLSIVCSVFYVTLPSVEHLGVYEILADESHDRRLLGGGGEREGSSPAPQIKSGCGGFSWCSLIPTGCIIFPFPAHVGFLEL